MTDSPLVDLTVHHKPCDLHDHVALGFDVVLVVRADEAHRQRPGRD